MAASASAESILAQMPHRTLTRIAGEPTHASLKALEKELAANLMAVPCPWGHNKGHLGLLQDPAIYLQRNGEAFNIPADAPPAYPADLAGNAAAGVREAARADNQAQLKAWETYIIVRTVTRTMIAEAIDDVYYAALDDPTEGLNGVSIQQLIAHVRYNYAHISQPEIDANMADFHQGIDAALPLAVYTRKQERCQTFALDARVPISEATMVTTGTKAALQCGGMTLAWREWQRRPSNDHTWNNWVSHWTAAFTEARDISRLTSSDTTFGANAAVTDNISQQMVDSLDNLANAAVARNTTVESLVATNQQQARTISDLTAAIAAIGAGRAATIPATNQQAHQPPHPQQQIQSGRTQVGPKPPWDRQGYCWTHGHKVKEGHNSGNCSYPRDGHQRAATRANTMGGCTRNRGWPRTPAPTPPAAPA